eukprot:GDKJ01037178.1.p1 GENE.GDKJ01037178.1~~GDKJ01037178.1.p1  ORF type:complete len:197 (-),score=36.39 GDKJ01037178.1:148-738(-)
MLLRVMFAFSTSSLFTAFTSKNQVEYMNNDSVFLHQKIHEYLDLGDKMFSGFTNTSVQNVPLASFFYPEIEKVVFTANCLPETYAHLTCQLVTIDAKDAAEVKCGSSRSFIHSYVGMEKLQTGAARAVMHYVDYLRQLHEASTEVTQQRILEASDPVWFTVHAFKHDLTPGFKALLELLQSYALSNVDADTVLQLQ